jgi:hypothetical protein
MCVEKIFPVLAGVKPMVPEWVWWKSERMHMGQEALHSGSFIPRNNTADCRREGESGEPAIPAS